MENNKDNHSYKKDVIVIIGLIALFSYMAWAIPEAKREWRVSQKIDWSESDSDPYYNVPNFNY